MAHLRDSFASRGISTQALELLLSSWRNKTNSSYNSLFAKWARWCEQRSRDPIAGPVEDVVNFLAELHAEGINTGLLMHTVQLFHQFMNEWKVTA